MNTTYYEIQIKTDKNNAEKISDYLSYHKNISFGIRDLQEGHKDETPVFIEGITDESPLWEKCLISIYCPDSIDCSNFIENIRKKLSLNMLDISFKKLKNIDWEKYNREQFHPIKISNKLWIIPSWENPVNKNAVNINLDPGLAFGTGMHETTKLCLKWLLKNIKGNETVIDYGCGSGILAILALKLGAKRAIVFDIDKQALIAAKENAEKNNVSIEFLENDEILKLQPDILIANILFSPLKQLSSFFGDVLQPKKQIVLSGIICEQLTAIEKIYNKWFKLQKPKILNDWVLISGKRL